MNYVTGDIKDGTEFCTMLLMFCSRSLITIGEALGGFETFLKSRHKTLFDLSDKRMSELFKKYCLETYSYTEDNIFTQL